MLPYQTNNRILELEKLFSENPRLLSGNLQIIACAGAGKTDFISWRIAFLIYKDIAKTENIVAFTFTERAAEELKFRIRHHIKELLGRQPDMGDMYVGTIHSFCFKLLQEFIPKYRVYDVLDEGKRYAFISSIKNDIDYKSLLDLLYSNSNRPFRQTEQSWVLNSFLRSVDIVREELLSPKEVSISDSFTEAFTIYEKALEEKRFLDFSSMISIAVNHLKSDPNLLKAVREKYTHITVDEYQDVNPIQEKLINLLAGENGNLCVVGDDDQSIYQWRGSTVENILTFEQRYKNVYKYELTTNYRSTDYIINCANTVIKNNNPNRLQKLMNPGSGKGQKGDIYKLTFKNQEDEIKFIVDRIKELIGVEYKEKDKEPRGLTYSDIAIFFRSVRYDAQPYIDALQEAGIPVAVSGIGGLFNSPEADIIFELLSYIGDFGKIWDRETGEGQVPEIENIYDYAKDHFLVSSKKQFMKYFEILKQQVKNKSRLSLQGLYMDILYGLGFQNENTHFDRDPAKQGEKEIKLYNLGRVSQAITDYELTRTYTTYRDIKGFCWFILDYAQGNYDAGAGDDLTLSLNAVQVMTLHATKGLGFPVVFMPYSVKRKDWPLDTGFLDPNKFDFTRYKGSNFDERRLFYVGMTRAKKFLCISYPKQAIGTTRLREPLPYFNEIPDTFCITKPIPDPARRVKSKPKQGDTEIRFPTSYSELSYYISCGYDYKLRFIYGFNPQLVEALGYGKQIHNIINILHKKAQETKKVPSLNEVIRLIKQHFYLRYASNTVREKLAKGAMNCIENYMRIWRKDFLLSIKTERPFELEVENALISGLIDLLKRSDNEDDNILEIIDFKTGKHRIEGEQMPLQVQLYTIAAREALGLNVKKAYLHFLDDKKASRIEIPITPKQLDLAMRTISHTIKSIMSRSFPRDAKNNHVCQACDWKKICPQRKI